jgi:hypothetical protein
MCRLYVLWSQQAPAAGFEAMVTAALPSARMIPAMPSRETINNRCTLFPVTGSCVPRQSEGFACSEISPPRYTRLSRPLVDIGAFAEKEVIQ